MSYPFGKVLCAVDFSPSTKITIEMATQIVDANKGSVVLFHVVPMPIGAIGQSLMVEGSIGAEDDARQRLNRIARESLTGPCEILVVTGDPAASIIESAKEQAADLILMATHGRTGMSHFFLGSVAERVVRESSVPVLTVRAPSEKHRLLSESVVLG